MAKFVHIRIVILSDNEFTYQNEIFTTHFCYPEELTKVLSLLRDVFSQKFIFSNSAYICILHAPFLHKSLDKKPPPMVEIAGVSGKKMVYE